jgi:hypothetical protein
VLARQSRSLAAVHGAALALAIGTVAYLHWPRSDVGVGYFVYGTVVPSQWSRDVALLVAALVAGFALPTAFVVRRSWRQPRVSPSSPS